MQTNPTKPSLLLSQADAHVIADFVMTTHLAREKRLQTLRGRIASLRQAAPRLH